MGHRTFINGRRLFLAMFVGIALLLRYEATAEEHKLRPGTYHGYVRQDRWGQKLFQYGRQAWFLTDEVFFWLQPLAGKPIVLGVTDIRRPDPSSPSLVHAISSATVERLPLELGLSLQFDPRRHLAGETLLATVTIHNLGAAPLDVRGRKVRLIVMRKSDLGLLYPEEEVLGSPAGAPSFGGEPRRLVRGDQGRPWVMAREIHGEWRNTSPVGKLEPGVTLKQTFAFGEDLPTGEFEIFAVWGVSDDPKALQPMSEVRIFELNAP
jgi:hypothetical protein